jgi:signal transduction histidine kinase
VIRDIAAGHGLGVYRQARIRTTVAAAVVLLVPFFLFYVLADRLVWNANPKSHDATVSLLGGAVLLGLVLSVGFGRFVSNHILHLAHDLEKALGAVEQRERERDSAQQELIRKLQDERELVKQKLQFESQLAEYEKYAALAQLALGAAHEINNPLLGILSHLELELKQAPSSEERVEIQQCIEATRRISGTIKSLISYARPGPLQLSKISIERLITETLTFLRHQPAFRNVHLEKHIAADVPPLTADANQISQVLVNLLLNAVQAMPPEGGTITLSAAVVLHTRVEIRITDTGAGIPADILPHIFEPFFTTKRGKGTGLGLSISQSYIRNHGGEIIAESTLGRGTSVRFTLPISGQCATAPLASEEVIV